MILYHASDVGGLDVLVPKLANHEEAFVYLSKSKEFVLAYLVNPVRKFCLENNIKLEGYHRWAVRFWDEEKQVFIIPEWWHNAFEEVYSKTPSYFYEVEKDENCVQLSDDSLHAADNFFCTTKPIKVKNVEVIPDTLKYLQAMQEAGKVILRKHEELTSEQRQRIERFVKSGYENAKATGETHFIKFLESKFADITNEKSV